MSATPKMNNSTMPLSQVLSTASGSSLRVPEYQRGYAWEKAQFSEFWDDISQFAEQLGKSDRTYFLGIVVLVDGDPPEILDGQQRITTATLLLSTICEFLIAEGERAYAERLFDRYIATTSLSGKIKKHRLVLNDQDQGLFRDLVSGDEVSDPATNSQRQLIACKKHFNDRLRMWRRDAAVDHIDKAKQVADVLLERVFVVTITAFQLEEAGSVFERLNDRGVGLKPVELVRSLVMQLSRADDKKVILQQWGEIYQQRPPANVDDLLRFDWVTRYGDATTGGLYKLIKAKFHAEEGKFDPVTFSRELTRAASVYRAIYGAAEGDDDYDNVAAALVELDARPMVPLLMKCHDFDKQRRSMIASVALNAFMRNRVIANASSTSFEDEVYQLAKDIVDTEDSIMRGCEKLGTYMLDDNRFKAAFVERQITRQKTAKFVLASLENHLIRKQAKGNKILVVGTSREVHLEHVYPKKPAAPEPWAASGQQVSRLGNMTLLGQKEGQGLGNSDFATKLGGYTQSQFKITKQLQQYDEWSPDQIKHRQEWMSEVACEVWPQFNP